MTTSGDGPCLILTGNGEMSLWGMTTAERLRRLFAREGINEADRPPEDIPCVMARADAVIDAPLIRVIASRPGLVLLSGEDGAPLAVHAPAGQCQEALAILQGAPIPPEFEARRPDELGADFHDTLRKREIPHAMILAADNRRQVEWRSFMATYKGATDLVTKYLWPRPAFHVTRWLAETPITPNMVTTASLVFVIAAFWLFWQGHYGWGLACAWFMTFLDTVDGKLARTTLTSSRWGNIFDHGIDLIHPPFWYWAWAKGLANAGLGLDAATWRWTLGVIIAGYIAQRLIEGAAIKWLGMEIHIWRPIDSFFRLITARRNPNLVILTVSAIAGRPDLGLIAVAWWTAICLLLHLVQLIQAFAGKRRAGRLVSWMSEKP